MKLDRSRWTALTLVGAMTLASLAPAVADAHSGRGCDCGSSCGADRIYPDENRWGRSYYYEDPYCGLRNSHVSAFNDHYSHAGHPPIILMRDIGTGQVINRYAWNGDDWRDTGFQRSCGSSSCGGSCARGQSYGRDGYQRDDSYQSDRGWRGDDRSGSYWRGDDQGRGYDRGRSRRGRGRRSGRDSDD